MQKLNEKLFSSISVSMKAKVDFPRDFSSISEYEDKAAIPFAQIFIDDEEENSSLDVWVDIHGNPTSDPNLNDPAAAAMSSYNGMAMRNSSSSTLPPMSEHQRRLYMKQFHNGGSGGGSGGQGGFLPVCKENSSHTLGRSPVAAAAAPKEDSKPNAVYEVLKEGRLLGKIKHQEEEEDEEDEDDQYKSSFYLGGLEEDENEDFARFKQQSKGFASNQKPPNAKDTAKKGGIHKINKLTKNVSQFFKLKKQPSTDSGSSAFSEGEAEHKRHKSKESSKGDANPEKKRNSNLYVALYNFDPVEKVDLYLRAGDYVKVLNDKDETWWFGECLKKTGYFPSNFVMKREINEKPLVCTRTTQVQMSDGSVWTLKKSQIVVVGEEHYKSSKSETEIYVRGSTSDGYAPRCHFSHVDKYAD